MGERKRCTNHCTTDEQTDFKFTTINPATLTFIDLLSLTAATINPATPTFIDLLSLSAATTNPATLTFIDLLSLTAVTTNPRHSPSLVCSR
jgi:hypothetical protein